MRKSNIFTAVFVAAALAATGFLVSNASVHAADFAVSTSRSTPYLHVAGGNYKNLYAVGRQVVIDSNVGKDLNVAGATVDVNGTVPDDALIVGGTVNVKGNIGGSAKILGGTVHISGKIGGDLAVAGGSVYLDPGAEVLGDVMVAGGSIFVNAPVHGNLYVAGGAAYVDSAVGGNIDARLSGVLQLGSGTTVGAGVNYTGRGTIINHAAHIAGSINYTKLKTNFADAAGKFLIKLLGLLLAALLLFTAFMPKYQELVNETQSHFWRRFGFGLIAFIVIPIITIVLFLLIVGYYVAILLALWYILMLFLGWIIGATAFGAWLIRKIGRREYPFSYFYVTFAIVVSVLLSAIPIAGPIFAAVLAIAGFGALLRTHKLAQNHE